MAPRWLIGHPSGQQGGICGKKIPIAPLAENLTILIQSTLTRKLSYYSQVKSQSGKNGDIAVTENQLNNPWFVIIKNYRRVSYDQWKKRLNLAL